MKQEPKKKGLTRRAVVLGTLATFLGAKPLHDASRVESTNSPESEPERAPGIQGEVQRLEEDINRRADEIEALRLEAERLRRRAEGLGDAE